MFSFLSTWLYALYHIISYSNLPIPEFLLEYCADAYPAHLLYLFNLIMSYLTGFYISKIILVIAYIYSLNYGWVTRHGSLIDKAAKRHITDKGTLTHNLSGDHYIVRDAHVIDNGIFELFESSYHEPASVCRGDGQSKFPHAWRFLWFDARLQNTPFVRLVISYLASFDCIYGFKLNWDNVDYSDIRFGHLVPWRTSESIPAGSLVYKNCGPLKAKTAWDVWTRLNGNDPQKPLFIAWTLNDNSFDVDNHNCFEFPHYNDIIDGHHYAWQKEVIDVNGNIMFAYKPCIQLVNAKMMPKYENAIGLVSHYHTFNINVSPKNPLGEYIVKECKCNSDCVEPCGSVQVPPPLINTLRPTHGLYVEEYTALMSHLLSCNDESAMLCIGPFLMAKVSWNKTASLASNYMTSLMLERKIYKTMRFNNHFMPFNSINTKGVELGDKKMLMNCYRPGQTVKAHPMIEFDTKIGGKVWSEEKKNKNAQTYRKAVRNKDFDLVELIIHGICSKYGLHRSFVYDTLVAYSIDLGGIRNCFGEGVRYQVSSKIQCSICKLYPPRKFKWYHGICPKCSAMCEDAHVKTVGSYTVPDDVLDSRIQASTLSYFIKPGASDLLAPTPIMPAEPKYKPKPLRPELKCGKEFTWEKPGYKLPRNPKQKPVSAPSQIIGITPARRATCLNLNGPEIEEQTIKVRMFAKPETGAQANLFSQLFEFAKRYNLIGPQRDRMRPMPLFPYDFSTNSWIARELMMSHLASTRTLNKRLERIKEVVDTLNAQLYHIDDWTTKDEKYWMSTFDPRKKKIYIDALLKFRLDVFENRPSAPTKPTLPRIFFKFFLKRELQPHTCDFTGKRSALNPRVICNPDAWSQLVLGPFLKQLTEELHTYWHIDAPLTYFGGLPPGQAKRWIKKCVHGYTRFNPKYTVALENDFSKFDSTYNRDAFNFIKQCYIYWGVDFNNELIDHVFEEWMRPKGQFRSGLKVSGPIMNASGRSDTALMNALINGLVQITSYCMAEQGVDDIISLNHERTTFTLSYIKIAVLGDDSLTFYSYFPGIDKEVGDMVAKFGFEARDMKVHFSPEKMVFLANRIYPVIDKDGNKDIMWGPTMRRLHKMGISEQIQPNPMSWLAQVTIASLITSDFVPYIGDIAKKQAQLLEGTKITSYDVITEKLAYKKGFLDTDLRVNDIVTDSVDFSKYSSGYQFDYEFLEHWLHYTYGAGLEDYYSFLDTLEEVTGVTTIITDGVLERMVSIDTGA